MLVPSMTLEELYKEIMRDFESIKRRSSAESTVLQKEKLRKKIQTVTRIKSYKTPFHNEWNIIFQLNPSDIKTAFYLKSNDQKGIVAYMLQFLNQGTANEERFVVKFSSHFFSRYNERMELGLTGPSKVQRHFFKNNFDYALGQSGLLVDGIRSIHLIFKEGIGIGWQSDAKKILHIKTFISNDTLNNKQLSLAEHIKNGEELPYTIKVANLQKAF